MEPRRLALLFGLIGVCLLPAATLFAAHNLLANGDFAQNTAGWDLNVLAGGPAIEMDWDAAEGNPAPGSLRLSVVGPVDSVYGEALSSTCFELEAETIYRLKTEVRMSTDSHPLTCYPSVVRYSDAGCTGTRTFNGNIPANPDDTWESRMTGHVSPVPTSVRIGLVMSFTAPFEGIGTCHFDSVSFGPATSPAVPEVPVLSPGGLIMLGLVLALSGIAVLARKRKTALLGLILLIPATTSHAAGLEVSTAAARSGSHGLRVALGSTCSAPAELDLSNQTVVGPFTHEACKQIVASDTLVEGNDPVVFRAGQSVAFGNGFRVANGTPFIVDISPSLRPDAFLVDKTPQVDRHYAVGFFLNADNAIIPSGNELDLQGTSASGAAWFRLSLGFNGLLGEHRLILYALDDNGEETTTLGFLESVVNPGWNWVSIDWRAATATTFDGHLRLFLNQNPMLSLFQLDNHDGRIDTIRFGAAEADATMTGHLDLDQFVSRVAGPIAPP